MEKNKRYYAYNFLIGDVLLLIDTKTKECQFYNTNLGGQIYNLRDTKRQNLCGKIRGLLTRMKNKSYSLENAYTIDAYLYFHFFTEEQKQLFCTPHGVDKLERDLLAYGNDLFDVLREMAFKVYDLEGRVRTEDFYGQTREQMLEYIDSQINEMKARNESEKE